MKAILPVAIALALLGALRASGSQDGEKPAPAIELPDTDGSRHRPLEAKDRKATVLIFITHECPIANAYAPEIKRIHAAYKDKGAALYLVHVDPDLTVEAAREHAKQFGHACTVLLDREHALVARVKATVVPEAFVIDAEGKLRYRGRIDDLFADYTKKRPEPTTRDLRAALDAVLAGKDAPVAETKAIGCFIAPLKREKP